MSELIYRPQPEQIECRIGGTGSDAPRLRVQAVSSSGLVGETDELHTVNEYLDINLELGKQSLALFGQVTKANGNHLTLHWLHFDPGEVSQLAQRLEEFAADIGLTGHESERALVEALERDRKRRKRRREDSEVMPFSGGHTTSMKAEDVDQRNKTRRIIKPRRKDTAEDLADHGATEPTITAGDGAGDGAGDSDREPKSRRIVRPSNRTIKPATPESDGSGERAPVDHTSGDALTPSEPLRTPVERRRPVETGSSSGGRHVVIADTVSFHKLSDTKKAELSGEDEAPSPANAGNEPESAHAHTEDAKAPENAQANKHRQSLENSTTDDNPGNKPNNAIKVSGKNLKRKQRVSKRMNVVGDDGKLDVSASLKSRSKTVRASELAARHDKVRVLNMSTIKELIQDAVGEAVKRLGGALEEAERKRLLEEAEEEFKHRLDAFKAEKAGLEEQAKNLQDQLQRAETMLEKEKNKVIAADQFTVSEQGMEDLAVRFDRLVGRAIKVNAINDSLSDELRSMVTHVLDDEREKIAEQARQAQNDAISLLEKKVKRLASNLENAEEEADRQRRIAAALEAGAGPGALANIMEAGMSDDDPRKEQKMGLLKDIINQNREVRDAMAASGKVITGRKRPTPPPASAADVSTDAAAATAAETGNASSAPTADANTEPAAKPADSDQPDTAAVTDDDATDDNDYDDMADPDDEIWAPGMAIGTTDIKGDNEADGEEGEEENGIKKMVSFANFAPPPLASSTADDEDSAATEITATENTDSPDGEAVDYDMVDPDDEIWEPGMTIGTTDIKGDNEASDGEDDEDGTPIKKMVSFQSFEPPPLQR